MAEALSRSEVESLLSALNPGQTPANRAALEYQTAPAEQVSSSELARRVVSLFEQFRHAMASATAQMLPEPVRIKRHMPVRVPFCELKHRADENPLKLLVESEQSGGDLLVIFGRQFAVQLVNCMLGQGNQPEALAPQSARQSLSPIEQRLLLRWLRESLTDVADPLLWKPMEIEVIDSHRDLDAYHGQSPWWCEIWELKSKHLRGRLELCGSWEFFSSLTQVAKCEESELRPEPESLERAPKNELPEAHGEDE